ncbi:MAG TPA: GYF domain-containing protein [Kofleriaceae bacterium]|jgi:predicted Zn finger-like uncharacterized protein
MKIVCDACQAKYSISDDKVQGKVFKIRCKKCSNIIVVRGGAGAGSGAEAAPAPQEKDTRVYDYGYDGGGAGGDEAVWHLVINQDQVGPMTVAEVQQRFAAGECDGETFAWREGFADWLPLAQVDTFSALVASGSTTSAQSGGGGAAAIGAMFGSGDDAGGSTRNDDLFSASARGGAHHEEDDGGGDLFGSKQPAAAAASASAGNSKLRGERNENSVLFSLNNLAQLASDKPAISAPSSQAGHATGAAGGEGSGLIDIRSMASAYMGGSGAAMGKPSTAASIGSIDDLPVFGGGGFSEPAVIVPSVGRGRDNRLLYLMIGAVTLLAVVAVIMVVILMRGPKKDANAVVASADNKAAADKDNKADKPSTDTGSAAAPAAAAADTGSAAAAPAPAPTAAPTPEATTTHSAPTPAPHHATSTASPSHVEHAEHTEHVAHSTPAPKSEPTPPPTKTSDSGGGGCDEVSCVINSYAGACCAKFHHAGGGGGAKPSGGGGADLPDALDRGMISSAIANVKARVTSCGEKSPSVHGKVKVHVKVGGDGRVSSVAVETTPDPGLGSCVQAAVQRASFAKTQSGGSFSYPFVF